METPDVQNDLIFSAKEIDDAMRIGANFIGLNHGGVGEISDEYRAVIRKLFTGAEKSDEVRLILTDAITNAVTVKLGKKVINSRMREVRFAALEEAATWCEAVHNSFDDAEHTAFDCALADCARAIRFQIKKEQNAR